MPVEIILYQIFILAIIALIGALGSKLGIISLQSKDFLAKLIFNITLPSMLLTNFSKIDLTPDLLSNSISVLYLAAFVLLFMLSFGFMTSRFLHLTRGEAGIFRLHSMMGNIIYLGFPVISALFGKEGLLYASIFTLVSNILMWTVGVITVSNGKNVPLKQNIKRILNPNTAAIILGFVLFLSSVKMPKFIIDSIGGLGSTNTFLSMIYIGSVLWYADVRKLLWKKMIWVLSFNRLILVPFILLGLYYLSGLVLPVKPDALVASVLIMQASMPCMVNVVIMVNILGEDDTIATANVFVSTILSILTLPLILYVMGLII
ncbi:MAG: AEC family transporter [Bacteroidales bacterium]